MARARGGLMGPGPRGGLSLALALKAPGPGPEPFPTVSFAPPRLQNCLSTNGSPPRLPNCLSTNSFSPPPRLQNCLSTKGFCTPLGPWGRTLINNGFALPRLQPPSSLLRHPFWVQLIEGPFLTGTHCHPPKLLSEGRGA